MPEDVSVNETAMKQPRWSRRSFLAGTGVGVASALASGAAVMGCGSTAPYVDAAGQSDANILNFALNLEYLEATFYSYLVTGKDIDGGQTGGGPTPQNPPPQITFPNQQTADLFAEIAFDEFSHVQALRSVLNSLAIQRPLINFAALAAVSQSNYLQIARLFEDVGVTAYAGAAGALTSVNVTAASQILAVEGFHAGALRLLAIQQNLPYPSTLAGYVPADGYDIIPADPGTVALASAGPTAAKGGFFATQAQGTQGQTNTYNGFAFQRSTSQVLAILYGSATTGTAKGGFFPNGVNGAITTV
ncbi:ferritin-like domain-containing protein [Terriglobus aquaticus]|uniref:Ferritin-like domain-containing protein n=1 Tax=Terriglobus aquaticus TaxID=940139 RepID=A0ABW9KNM4_9BACT|nr:ferritin-like domain-containing protein [Terriglobus aquaticus]